MSIDESRVEALERILEHQQDRISFLERELERRGDETERLHQIVAGLTRATAELSSRLPELEAPATPEARQSPESVPATGTPTDAGRGAQRTLGRLRRWLGS